MAQPIDLPVWPHGAAAAVSLTFDVDADPAWIGMDPRYDRHLSTLSQFRYGVVRGLPRVLRLLEDRAIRATFYVPGATAAAYPGEIREIADAGHELAHHGYDHVMPQLADPARQRDEIERGISALYEAAGATPRGYRAPCAELMPETLALLLEHRFQYDSSCMGDDRPYIEDFEGMRILELPMHWSLDDAPYFLYTAEGRGLLRSPEEVLAIWDAELRMAVREGRHVTYVMHPEIIGRGPQISALERFLDDIGERHSVWFATHGEVATAVVGSEPVSQAAGT